MDFSPYTFLLNDWQQQPRLLTSFFTAFTDPLDEHDLAGLAQYEEVDSRIVYYHDKQWGLEEGPFTRFEDACKGNWTLLVQGVDRFSDDVSALTQPFRFIPDWRIDDVMVSFATPGAGVGPHVDQYDVFLVQGRGKRRWRVGKPGNYKEVFPHPRLRQIEHFEPILDVELSPGDVLYIPPGWAHEGVSVTDSMTYSIGFRAPDTRQLGATLAEFCDRTEPLRYADPQRRPAKKAECVTAMDRQALKAMLHDIIASDAFDSELMRMLSEQHLPVYPAEDLVTAAELQQKLVLGAVIRPVSGCRPLFKDTLTQNPIEFFIDGEIYTLTTEDRHFIEHFATGHPLNVAALGQPPSLAICETLATLINKGYWLLDEV